MRPDILRTLQFALTAGAAGYCSPFAFLALFGGAVPRGHWAGMVVGVVVGAGVSRCSHARLVHFLLYPLVAGLLFPALVAVVLPLKDWNALYSFFVGLYAIVGFLGGLCVAFLQTLRTAV